MQDGRERIKVPLTCGCANVAEEGLILGPVFLRDQSSQTELWTLAVAASFQAHSFRREARKPMLATGWQGSLWQP